MNSFKILKKSYLASLEDELIKPIINVVNTYISKIEKFKAYTCTSFKELTINKECSFNVIEPNVHTNKLKPFKGLISDISIKNFKTNVLSIIELNDKRIATAGADGSISVISINIEKKIWSHEIKKENAHDDEINCLCELRHNILISCSDDKLIKIWKVTSNDLILDKTLSNHTANIRKVISLSQKKFASCSQDFTIRIWNSISPYQQLTVIDLKHKVYSIIQLSKHDLLIASSSERCIQFWNVNTCKKEHSIKEIYTLDSLGMIELDNGCVAVSSDIEGYPIVIIDCVHYLVVKKIWNEEFIPCGSSLCACSKEFFIYVCNGCFLQISAEDYVVLHKSKNEEKLFGNNGIVSISNGKYFIVDNYSDGLDVLCPYY